MSFWLDALASQNSLEEKHIVDENVYRNRVFVNKLTLLLLDSSINDLNCSHGGPELNRTLPDPVLPQEETYTSLILYTG
jgi:hypothetical protein